MGGVFFSFLTAYGSARNFVIFNLLFLRFLSISYVLLVFAHEVWCYSISRPCCSSIRSMWELEKRGSVAHLLLVERFGRGGLFCVPFSVLVVRTGPCFSSEGVSFLSSALVVF